jgi:hypothetical protein
MILPMAFLIVWLDSGPPALGDRVVEFARSHLGEKVGSGDCSDLVRSALRDAGTRPGPWGEPVGCIGDARPGDVLVFTDAVFRGRKKEGGRISFWSYRLADHIAIVEGTDKRKGALIITILHQNVGYNEPDPEKKKVVQRWTISMEELREGTVRAFRPTSSSEANR